MLKSSAAWFSSGSYFFRFGWWVRYWNSGEWFFATVAGFDVGADAAPVNSAESNGWSPRTNSW